MPKPLDVINVSEDEYFKLHKFSNIEASFSHLSNYTKKKKSVYVLQQRHTYSTKATTPIMSLSVSLWATFLFKMSQRTFFKRSFQYKIKRVSQKKT